MNYKDGSVYKGEFANGQPNGEGMKQFPNNGLYYRGYFKNGLMEGQGLMHWPDGRQYMGSFKND